jgi:hypothetical protein
VTRILGVDKLLAAKRLLASPSPDLLRILGREDDENSHSDLIVAVDAEACADRRAAHAA